MKATLQNWQSWDIRITAVILSCLFSLIVIASHPIPNDDAFSYLKAADLYNQSGLEAMLSAYGWYGYSALIAFTDSFLPLDTLASAHLLNMLSCALLTWAFITLCAECHHGERIPFFAAAIILVYPTINEMRYELIRDFFYWACCLSALIHLIRFHRSGHWMNAVGWMLAMITAVFFRLEGLLLLALSPFALLMSGKDTMKQRLYKLMPLGILGIVGLTGALLVFSLAGIHLVDVFRFAYRWYLPLLTDFTQTILGAADSSNLSYHLSSQLAPFTGKGLLVLLFGVLYSVLANLADALGNGLAVLTLYWAYRYKTQPEESARWPWLFFLGGSLFTLLLFVCIMQFLTSRYAVMSALMVLVLLPRYLDQLYVSARAQLRLPLFNKLFAAALFYFTVDSLVSFGYSKQYIEDAIDWTQSNVPADSMVQTNSYALAYFTGLVSDYDQVETDPLITLGTTAGKHFLILALSHRDAEARELASMQAGLQEVAHFANKRNDAIVIYRIN
jgi:hypothetical protein